MYYPATFIPHNDGSNRYDIVFADLPGCVSQGIGIEHALDQAQEALSLHVGGMLRDGDALPAPSTLESARLADLAEAEEERDPLPQGTFWQYVPALGQSDQEAPEPVNLTLSLKSSLLRRMDDMAAETGLTRSEIATVAAREYILRHQD